MVYLTKDWFLEGHLDFEFQQYRLLSYIQGQNKRLDCFDLFPTYNDVKKHVNNLKTLALRAETLREGWQKELKAIDLKTFTIEYQYKEVVNPENEVLNQIVQFALPKLDRLHSRANNLKENLERDLTLDIVGIQPVNVQHGYLFLPTEERKTYDVLKYQQHQVTDHDKTYPSLSTTWITSFTHSIHSSFESVKKKLIGNFKSLPNPMVLVANIDYAVPYKSCLQPISIDKSARFLHQLNCNLFSTYRID